MIGGAMHHSTNNFNMKYLPDKIKIPPAIERKARKLTNKERKVSDELLNHDNLHSIMK